MSAPLPDYNPPENMLFISAVWDIVHCFSFFNSLECFGISHLLTKRLELQEIARLSAGMHCKQEHMSNCCIYGVTS